MRVPLFVLCREAGVAQDGAPYVFGIFREIKTVLPAHIDPVTVALEVEADPSEVGRHEFELRIIDQDGKTFFSGGLEAEFSARPKFGLIYSFSSHRVRLREPVLSPGRFRLELIWRTEPIAQLGFEICQI